MSDESSIESKSGIDANIESSADGSDVSVDESNQIIESDDKSNGEETSVETGELKELDDQILKNVNESSDNLATSHPSRNLKKRKSAPFTVNLLQYVNFIHIAYKNSIVDVTQNPPLIAIPKRIITSIEDPAKRVKSSDEKTATALDEKIRFIHRHSVYKKLVVRSIVELEEANATFQFSKETLKYFLATHAKFLWPTDFSDTNFISNERRTKNNAPLPPGGSLQEYCKGLDAFTSSINRADKDDIQALRFILENKIELSPEIYSSQTITFADPKYETDSVYTPRDGYSLIANSSLKRAVVLVTNTIIMIYDGHQFVVPPISLERDITTKSLQEANLGNDEYVLFDMLLMTRNKVLDVIDANIGEPLSPNYDERMEYIRNRFPDLKQVAVMGAVHKQNDTSYIQKPMRGRGISYVYTKPNPTGAVIGTFEKHACIAFKLNPKILIVKTKCSISGPTLFSIMASSYQTLPDNFDLSRAAIRYKGQVFALTGDLNEVHLLQEAIPVELRDGNKLGNISTHEISGIHDYKPTTSIKDSSIDNTVNLVLSNPTKYCARFFRHPDFERLRQLFLTAPESSINVDFGSYN
ncbi:GbNV_gp37-like [Fopius arisanus]|nr:GbNV_gp37-like [Fopius arisanus]